MTVEEWEAEGRRRFGPDKWKWRFVCPVCGHVATPEDWRRVGAEEGAVAFSCIGRWLPKSREALPPGGIKRPASPCNYAGGGLFRLNPVLVDGVQLFAFADAARLVDQWAEGNRHWKQS